jgi:hypothetical protein
MLKRILAREIAMPWSENDLAIFVNDKDAKRPPSVSVPRVDYKDLPNHANISSVLGPHKCCFLFLSSGEAVGHWIALLEQNGTVEVFDETGMGMDAFLSTMSPEARQRTGQTGPFLSHLLHESGKKVVVNKHVFQDYKKRGTNTCGRWAAMRVSCHFKGVDLATFTKLFGSSVSVGPDEIIALISMFVR